MSSKRRVQVAVGKVAAASRKTHKGVPVTIKPGALKDAKAELIAARLEEAIEEALNPKDPDYPAIYDKDRQELAAKLLGLL